MGEAVGIDLGTAVSAVARRRGDSIEPRLVPTAELAGPGDTAGALAALAGAAGDQEGPAPVVAVVVPALDAGRGEVEEAARAAFGAPVLTPRPVAAAAWFRYRYDVRPGANVVVVEGDDGVEGPAVVVTVVRDAAGGPAVEGPAGGLIGPRDPARDAVEIVALALRSAALVPTATDVAVVIGGAAWLDDVAGAIAEVTGLAAVVEPEPQSAAACGAALLAGGPGGPGAAAAGGTLALGGAAGALVGGAALGPAGTGIGAGGRSRWGGGRWRGRRVARHGRSARRRCGAARGAGWGGGRRDRGPGRPRPRRRGVASGVPSAARAAVPGAVPAGWSAG